MEYLFWRRRLQGILANASDSTMLRLLAADVTELAYHIQWHAEAPHAAQESLTATANTILRDAWVCKMCATDHLGTYASFVASTDAISHHATPTFPQSLTQPFTYSCAPSFFPFFQ